MSDVEKQVALNLPISLYCSGQAGQPRPDEDVQTSPPHENHQRGEKCLNAE